MICYIYSIYEIYNSKGNIILEGRCNQFNIMNFLYNKHPNRNRGNVYSCIKNICFKVSTGWTWTWGGRSRECVRSMAEE